jgi:hypothetical protein
MRSSTAQTNRQLPQSRSLGTAPLQALPRRSSAYRRACQSSSSNRTTSNAKPQFTLTYRAWTQPAEWASGSRAWCTETFEAQQSPGPREQNFRVWSAAPPSLRSRGTIVKPAQPAGQVSWSRWRPPKMRPNPSLGRTSTGKALGPRLAVAQHASLRLSEIGCGPAAHPSRPFTNPTINDPTAAPPKSAVVHLMCTSPMRANRHAPTGTASRLPAIMAAARRLAMLPLSE